MADQTQTESFDEGATKDLSSIIEPGATVNSGDKTRGIAFHFDSTDNESSAEENEGVNGMTNKSTNEESRIDVNDEIADDEHDIIHDTIRKGGSDKVAENKKCNETVSLCADETVDKRENTVGKGIGETFYRGNDTKNNESNDKVTQKSNNGANDKENNQTSDTSHEEETIPGTDKKTHAGERHEKKTSNDETNEMTSKPADERNDEATQKGNNANAKGKNEGNDTSQAEEIKTETSKISHEGESDENKTDNDETNVLISAPTDDGNDKVTQHGNNTNDKGYNETSDTSHSEKIKTGTVKITHEGVSDENKTDNDETNLLMCKPDNVKHNEASNNGEGETNNDGSEIIPEDVKPDQTDATVKERSQTFEDDSCSKETPDKKMITDLDRQETAEKETNDEDANRQNEATMTRSNESPAENDEAQDKKKTGVFAGVRQGVSSIKGRILNMRNEKHTSVRQSKQPSVTNSIEEDVKPHDDKKSASSSEKHRFNIGFLPKTKSNKKKDTYISDSQAKEAPDACRDSMPIQDENKQWKKKHQQLLNETREEKESNAKTLNETNALLKARDGELDGYRSVIQQNNADISQLTVQIQQLQEEKSDLLLRLSKVASAKLTQNNPNIADLSDVNRPTKLAEQFSELYDNEYTDTIEELKEQQGLEEQAAVANMLTLLQAANEECVELARKQEHGKTCLTTFSFKVDQYPILRERSMLTDSGDNECLIVKTTIDQETDEVRIEIQLPDEHSKSLSDIRRLCATKVEEDCSMSKIIASKIALQRGITPESGPKTLAYITKCAKLCWYMVIKEPPVLVGFHAVVDGEHFNKDMYKSYTKAGEFLDFVVWPPLYLHKDGPLLCKGVAQGK